MLPRYARRIYIWCTLVWILSRVCQKMEIPLLEHSHWKFYNYDIILSRNFVLQYSRNVQKSIGTLISLNVLYLVDIKWLQFVHNTKACLKNRQGINYQWLAFELNAFCLGTPVAFPQHILVDVNKQIAQITQRQIFKLSVLLSFILAPHE